MRRLFPSHPDYEKINALSHLIAAAKNPQVHFDVNHDYRTADKLMWKAYISDLEKELEGLLENNPFKDFLLQEVKMKYEHWYQYREQEEDRPPTLREEMLRLRDRFREVDSAFEHPASYEYCIDHDVWSSPVGNAWIREHSGCNKLRTDDYQDVFEFSPALKLLNYLLDYSE